MFSFIHNRFRFYSIAVFLVIFSLLTPWIFGVNTGIDMTGGIQIEYTVSGNREIAMEEARKMGEVLKKEIQVGGTSIVNGVTVYGIAGTNSFIVEAGFSKANTLSENDMDKAKTTFTKNMTDTLTNIEALTITQSRYVNIGESFGAYIRKSGYITLTIAVIMIAIYIAYAFRGSIPGMSSWPFAVVTGISLLHDMIVSFGLYIMASYFFPEFKVDTFFITALLTILGYSINDTIVVMDRIRSNLRDNGSKKVGLSHIIDTAIHDTMRRSILTSMTIFIVLVSLFFFGPESLKGFSLVLLFGTVVGTYSSICIASPLLFDITKRK